MLPGGWFVNVEWVPECKGAKAVLIYFCTDVYLLNSFFFIC